jgi:hypothetical protein
MQNHDEQAEVEGQYKPLSTYLHDIQVILAELPLIDARLKSMIIALWVLVAFSALAAGKLFF